jgi:hypothetical protein
MAALRADKALRPFHMKNILFAMIFSGEATPKLLERHIREIHLASPKMKYRTSVPVKITNICSYCNTFLEKIIFKIILILLSEWDSAHSI